MSTVAALLRRLEAVNVYETTIQSVEETKPSLIELNSKQMVEGIRTDGEKIHWLKDAHYPYTKPYANKKAKKGLQTSVVDLNYGVGIAKSEQIKVEGNEIQFSSSIKLGEYLEQNYGKQIFGLTNENRKTYTFHDFFKAFKTKIETITGLRFE